MIAVSVLRGVALAGVAADDVSTDALSDGAASATALTFTAALVSSLRGAVPVVSTVPGVDLARVAATAKPSGDFAFALFLRDESP